MSAASLETLLARLYTDEEFRDAFLADPERIARAHGDLDETEIGALRDIDRDGVEFAARSFAHKRAAHAREAQPRSWLERFVAWSPGRRRA